MGTYVQGSNTQNDASATTIASPAITVTAGNMLFWAVAYGGGASRTVTCAGNSNTYTEIGTGVFDGFDGGIHFGYAKNTTVGSTVVTATFNAAATFRAILVAEWSGFDTTTPFGSGENAQQFQVGPTGTDGFTSGLVSPAFQPGTLMGFVYDTNLTSIAPGTGMTQRFIGWDFGFTEQMIFMSKTISSTTPVAITATGGTDNYGFTAAAMFRDAAAPGGGSILRQMMQHHR